MHVKMLLPGVTRYSTDTMIDVDPPKACDVAWNSSNYVAASGGAHQQPWSAGTPGILSMPINLSAVEQVE